MPGAYLYGWDSAAEVWVKLLANADGKLIIDPSEIFEDPPTDGETGKAPTSNWAHDHPLIVRKTADETVNNSATLQNDDELLFAIAANEVWEFEFVIIHIGNTTADIKFAVTCPAGATIQYRHIGKDASGTMEEDMADASGEAVSAAGYTTNSITKVEGIVANAGTAGSLQLQWAQNTKTVVNTKVLANSCLIAHKLA
jgi:hypothetical protein